MAGGWVSLLKLVPWGEVARHAPKVAEGARGLWDRVAGQAQPAPVDARVQGQLDEEARAIDDLRAELRATAAAVEAQQARLLAATALIKDLADQNAQLVREVGRLRTLLHLGLAVAAALAVLALLLAAWR